MLIKSAMAGTDYIANYQVDKLLNTTPNSKYYRINPQALSNKQLKHVRMDNSSKRAIRTLISYGQEAGDIYTSTKWNDIEAFLLTQKLINFKIMANCNKEFRNYDENISIPTSKRERMSDSRESSRSKIIQYFKEHHPGYDPTFWIQGSHKNGLNIRTQDDNCDQDDGIHFNREPKDSVDGTTLQKWVFDAVKDDTTEGAEHRNKCIRKKYKENDMGKYHIDYPLYYQTDSMAHPLLAVKIHHWSLVIRKSLPNGY